MEQNKDDAWQETDSALFLDFGCLFTPARQEIAEVLLDLVPAERDEAFLAVDVGTGQGWLSEAILQRFPAARVLALDGSSTMLRQAQHQLAPFGERVAFRHFRLEDSTWIAQVRQPVRCFLSSLVLHHLDGPGKQALFAQLYERLEPGGALLMADLVEPTSAWGRRYLAHAWDVVVRQQSLDLTGNLEAYDYFRQHEWNYYDYPDPIDMPSPLPDQLQWLAATGFTGVDAFWAKAGHTVFGGYKPTAGG